MMKSSNLLLNQISADDLDVLAPHLHRIELRKGDVLFEPHSPIPYVYFFEDGLSSEIATSADDRLEVGCIGREGFSGAPVVLGADTTPHRSFMQAGGLALRISSAELREATETLSTLRRTLLLFVHVFMLQVASTALADGRCNVEQRLARWLLMGQDRLGHRLPLTHEFFALMLGVRRSSVTDALHILEGTGCIRSERSLVTIQKRSVLEEIAGAAYGIPEAEYKRLILAEA